MVKSSCISTGTDLMKTDSWHYDSDYHDAGCLAIKKTRNRPGFSFEICDLDGPNQDCARGHINATQKLPLGCVLLSKSGY
jgi:hypothetical protein